MDHNKKPTVSTGHEVYLCHRCGWPFPNPHPSSRHRRAHKKICGTVEGYEIFESRSDDHQVSDDEHNSDENEHTPSPKVEKRSAKELGSSGGVGGRSNKSEEDVFSDAISEFSDSGISPKLGERFEQVKGMDMIMEQEIVGGDLTGIELKKVDEAADQMEQLNISTSSDQNCIPAPLADAPDASERVLVITDTKVEPVPVQDSNALQPNLIKSEILMDRVDEFGDKEVQQGMVKAGQDTDIQREDKFASVVLDTKEGKTLGPASVSEAIKHDDPSPYSQVFQFQGPESVPVEKRDVLCDKLVAEVVKHDQSPLTETLEDMNATAEAEGDAISAEVNESTGTIDDVALADEASEQIVGVTDDSNSAKVVECTSSIDENSLAEKSVQTSAATDSTETGCSDAVAVVSSIEKEVEQKTSLTGGENAGELNPNEGENCDIVGSENKSQELEEKISGEVVFADTSYAPENDQTTSVLKEDINPNDDKVLDSVVQSVNSTVVPSSCQVDTDAEHLKEVSKTEADLLESTDNGSQKSSQEFCADTDTKVLLEVGSTGLDAGLDHDTSDALDKNSQTTTSEEPATLPVNSDLPHNNHVKTDAKQVEHTDVSEMASEFKHNGDVIAPESTSEPPISEDSAPLFKDDNENTGTSLDDRASESVEAAEVTTEPNHNGDVILSKNSESTTLEKPEALPPSQECLKETSPEGHTSKDADSSKSVDIAPAAEQTCDNNAAPSEKHRDSSKFSEPVSLPIIQAIDESSATANEGDVKLTKEKDGGSAMDLSGSYVSRSDSLEAKCGSVSDKSETNLQAPKTTTEEAFEAPSFMTLVQSDNKVDDQSSEIETVKNNQQPKSDALQAGWFPSLTNVVNESEGRKKNEEIIAKVTEWNQGKQHGPLKNLLNEAKSPNTKQVPPANQKDEVKDNGATVTTVGSVLGNDNKEAEKEWDSPARYPTEIKKEKKKGKAYWVPFVCCSSVHRDL